MPGPAGPARRLALLVLGVALVLSGCAALPTEGPIVNSDGADASAVRRASDISPRPPADGAPPADVVTGFLDAMTAWPIATTTARQYLTANASERWRPQDATIVYDDVASVRTAASAVQVDLDGAQLLDDAGAWRGALSSERSSLRMRLTIENGQYRIIDPPDALVVPESWFRQRFQQVSLFYLDPTRSLLVPEPVFLPAGEQLATNLVAGLLAGPPPRARGVVRTALPAGLSVGLSVTVDDGVAEVSLGGAPSLLSEDDVGPMLAQLAWTLRQVSGVRALRVTIAGRPVNVPGASLQYPISGADAYDPSGEATTDALYGISQGRLVTDALSEDAAIEVAGGPFGAAGSGVVSAAVRPDGQLAAVVDAGGRRVRVASVTARPAGSGPRTVLSGGRYVRPTYDVAGRLWVVDQTARGAVVRVVGRSGTRVVEVPGISGRTVRRLLVSRDGTRLVAVVATPDGDAVVGARVVLDERGRVRQARDPVVVRAGEGAGSLVTDLAWSSPVRLVLLRPTTPGRLYRVEAVPADGAALGEPLPSTVISGAALGVAAAPGSGTPVLAVYADQYADVARQEAVPTGLRLTDLDYAG